MGGLRGEAAGRDRRDRGSDTKPGVEAEADETEAQIQSQR